MSKTTEQQTSAMIKKRPIRRAPRPPPTCLVDCPARCNVQAGAIPQTRQVAPVSARVKPSTRRSMRATPALISLIESVLTTRRRAYANAHPAMLPAIVKTAVSVKTWRMSRSGLAPSARRVDISRRRDPARASSRLATFEHAMIRTNPTAPHSITSTIGTRSPKPGDQGSAVTSSSIFPE
jgi:hypothetical protein